MLATPEANAIADSIAPAMIVVGVLVLAVILMVSLRRGRPRPEIESPHDIVERAKAAAERPTAENAAVELLELTRRLSAQLDTKAARLEQLIDDAQQIIDAMQPERAAEAPPASSEPASPDDHFTANVYRMADDGRSPVEIAQALDEQVGKVELVLALRTT